jgi:hypothetical protein
MTSVDVFFYGSYINLDVLAEVDLHPDTVEVAYAAGFSFTIAPLANLVPQAGAVAWGILTRATHDELNRLYIEHAQRVLGGHYLPQAIVCQTTETSGYRPALTGFADRQDDRPLRNEPILSLRPRTQAMLSEWMTWCEHGSWTT